MSYNVQSIGRGKVDDFLSASGDNWDAVLLQEGCRNQAKDFITDSGHVILMCTRMELVDSKRLPVCIVVHAVIATTSTLIIIILRFNLVVLWVFVSERTVNIYF